MGDGRPRFEIPPRTATDAAIAPASLRVSFDVDLGELCEGHHVVARGIQVSEPWSYLHYEFVPGMTSAECEGRPFFWLWTMQASDDLGTDYGDVGGGAFADSGGVATHGVRDIGCAIPQAASLLTLRFEPADGWEPDPGAVEQLTIDLRTGAAQTRP